ncbi:MAG TPA: DUF6220 domain-containing protein [Candidatus Saccharimonadia bacterium]|nr:DUF6220 domain-containing protein [Candidatus Saccharimonadia bacterium]
MVRTWSRWGFLAATWLFVACAVIQVFLAGLGVFGQPAGDFKPHSGFGYTFGWLVLVILVLAIVGRTGRRDIGLAVLLLVLFALQSVFVAIRGDYPTVAALHPVNGFLILLVGIIIGLDAWRMVQADRAAARRAAADAGPIA